MIALIGNLIVKACLIIGIVILSAGAGIITYGGAHIFKNVILPSPSPAIESEFKKSWVTPSSNPTPKPTVKKTQPIPSLTPDPDPIVTCKSKTGDIQVRHSICKSYTDCPDGYGGYIFESQESCKKRWERIEKELTQSVKNYTDALLEGQRLRWQFYMQQAEYEQQLREIEMQSKMDELTESILESDYTVPALPLIIESSPEPTPNYEGTQVWGW